MVKATARLVQNNVAPAYPGAKTGYIPGLTP